MIQKDGEDLDMKKRIKLRRWEKFYEFPSVLPDRLVHKFESEEQGTFKIKFSHSGKYLAAACTL